MEEFSQAFEEIVSATLKDIQTQAQHPAYDEQFRNYKSLLLPSIERYRHHHGETLDEDGLKIRYHFETALLHILTHIISVHIRNLSHRHFRKWPVSDRESPFNWYKLPKKI